MGNILFDMIKDFAFDKSENLLEKLLFERKFRRKFVKFSDRYFNDKIKCNNLKEEIDFHSLNKFISKNIFNQIKDELFLEENDYKSFSNSYFLKSCLNVAGANTPEKKRIVCSYVKDALKFLKDFYYDEYGNREKVLVSICVDNISKNINKRIKDIEINFEKLNTNLTYKDSFASVIDGISPKTINLSPFHYRNDIITFRGREEEQKEIYSFLDDERKLLWMSISGDGGSGKSKLMYHMTQKLESNDCWKVIWLGEQSLQSIMSKDKFEYPVNLLFVCDYGGQFAEKLGDFIERLCTFDSTYSEKIRLVILERDGFNQDCDSLLEPMWYRSFRGNISRNHCIDSTAFDKNKSLKLKSLNDDDFRWIVKDYLAEKKKSLTDEEINTVIEKAHKIDHRKTGVRPLILLFVADAVANGKEAKNWDLNKLVEHVIKRYEDHWKNVICKGDEELFKAVKEITAYATAVGGWNMEEELGEPLKKSCAKLCEREDINEIICAVCEKSEYDGIWSPFEPDLVGEFYVLNYLNEKMQRPKITWEKYILDFSNICWKNSSIFFIWFLSRCVQNYCRQERFRAIFSDGMEMFEPKYEENVVWYSRILINMTFFYQTVESVSRIVKKLEIMSRDYTENREIHVTYAKGLVNLSRTQELKEREKTIEKLEELWKSAPENREVRTEYAKGLYNLSCIQDLKEREKTIEKLEKLWNSALDNQDILTIYAKGLINLSSVQELKERENTIKKLEELRKSNSENQEVQTAYAKGLYNLSSVQELKERENTIKKLGELWKSNSENQEVQTAYAKGLINLSSVQELKERENTIKKLEELWKLAPENQDILTIYAKGLVNLIVDQNAEKGENTIEKLKELWKSTQNNREVQIEYAKGLFNLSCVQELREKEKTIKKLEELWESTSKNQEIQTRYAYGLYNLSCNQELKEREKTTEKLEELWKSIPENQEVQTVYAKGLVNLIILQGRAKYGKTIEKLEELWKSTCDNQEVQAAYAKGLYNLSRVQELKESEKIIEKLEELWKSTCDNQEVQAIYARGLYNLSYIQELKESEKTIEKLEELWKSTCDNQEVQVTYAKGLYNLSCNQDLRERKNTIDKLKELWKSVPENQEIMTLYAEGLVNLSIGQDILEMRDTIEKLKNLESKYPRDFIIQTDYSIGVMGKILKEAQLYKTKEPIESDIAEIKKYAEEHKDNEELQGLYNQFLDGLNKLFP